MPFIGTWGAKCGLSHEAVAAWACLPRPSCRGQVHSMKREEVGDKPGRDRIANLSISHAAMQGGKAQGSSGNPSIHNRPSTVHAPSLHEFPACTPPARLLVGSAAAPKGPPAYGWARLQCPPTASVVLYSVMQENPSARVQRHHSLTQGAVEPYAGGQRVRETRCPSSCRLMPDDRRPGTTADEMAATGTEEAGTGQDRIAQVGRAAPGIQSGMQARLCVCQKCWLTGNLKDDELQLGCDRCLLPRKDWPRSGVPRACALQFEWRIPVIAQPYFVQVCVQHCMRRVGQDCLAGLSGCRPPKANQKCAPP